MKKIVILMFLGLLLSPAELLADKYKSKKVTPQNHLPRTPSLYYIGLYLEENTGELTISPNYSITDLNITIMNNGVTYYDATVSLLAGQSYTDCLDFLGEGTYTLTLSTTDGVTDQYI